MKAAPRNRTDLDEAAVVTKAALRAAERLGLKNNIVARVIGVSEPTLSRLRRGDARLDREQKPFELALLFVRLYRSLDAIVDGDDHVARSWMRNQNVVLNGRPLDLIQSVAGLTYVLQYLDARRAVG